MVLSIGCNCGERDKVLRDALECLAAYMSDTRCSSLYETPAVGANAKGTYMNAVVRGGIREPLDVFNSHLKEIELSFGRDAESRLLGLVPLDIDIVMCDGNVIRSRDFDREFFQLGYRQLSE